MRASYRLVATDLDGTLVRPDGTISDRTRRTLRAVEEADVRVVLVTARPPRVARQFAAAAGTTHPLLICCNGALVFDAAQDAIVRHSLLMAGAAEALVAALQQHLPDVCFAAELGTDFGQDRAYAALVAAAHAGEPIDLGTPLVVAKAAALCQSPVTKLIVRHPEQATDVLLSAVRAIVGSAAAVTHSGGPFVELSAIGVDKAVALGELCTTLGVSAAEVIAFGDMPNDVPMLRWAGLGIAVANAHPDFLAAADELTASNAEDGVAVALERLILNPV